MVSRTPHGRNNHPRNTRAFCSRTPHGVRGLKSPQVEERLERSWSHPSRGAWIEIDHKSKKQSGNSSRTPNGVRGLKFQFSLWFHVQFSSHSSRSAWIEIRMFDCGTYCGMSHSSRSAWIEILTKSTATTKFPKSQGGTDEYQNLILVTATVNKLIHATNADTIQKYLQVCNPDFKKLSWKDQLPELKTMKLLVEIEHRKKLRCLL